MTREDVKKIDNMESKEFWIVRNKDGILWAFEKKPIKYLDCWISDAKIGDSGKIYKLFNNIFPDIKWKDKEPTKAIITLIK